MSQVVCRRACKGQWYSLDGSAANEAAIKSSNAEHGTVIEIRQVKELNNAA